MTNNRRFEIHEFRNDFRELAGSTNNEFVDPTEHMIDPFRTFDPTKNMIDTGVLWRDDQTRLAAERARGYTEWLASRAEYRAMRN